MRARSFGRENKVYYFSDKEEDRRINFSKLCCPISEIKCLLFKSEFRSFV
jgi:hypothetical protein